MRYYLDCPKCGHRQKLGFSTIAKLKAHGTRTIRCSRCHGRIRTKWSGA